MAIKKHDPRNNVPDPIPFTQEKMDKMQQEFDHLTTEREQILIRLQTAREMGDLSENGAYKYAKFELRDTDHKLRQLRFNLRWGIVVKSQGGGIVDFGCTVTIKSSDKQRTFTVVSKHEANPMEDKLSSDSPFGIAVLGKKVGDTVKVQAPDGSITYEVTEVK